MATAGEHEHEQDDQSGYGAADENAPGDTPFQEQPQRPEHEPADEAPSPEELREQREAEERQSGRGAV